jgi:hypothetical protein
VRVSFPDAAGFPHPVLVFGPPSAATGALTGQITRLGYEPRPVDAEAGGGLVGALDRVPAGLPVAVVDSRVACHTHVLRRFLLDSRADVMLLEPGHGPTAGFACSGRARDVLATVATSEAAARSLPDLGAALATAARLAGLAVRTVEVGTLALGVLATDADRMWMREQFAAVERAGGEERLRRREAVKRLDNPVAAHLMSPWTSHVAVWLSRHGVAPDAVTGASFVVAAAAGLSAIAGTRTGYLGALLLAMLSFALDCCDGQMARYAVRYSAVGAWLDIFGDRVKELVLLSGLAIGAARSWSAVGANDRVDLTWWLAGLTGAITLVRAFVAFGFPRAYSQPSLPQPAVIPTGFARLRFDLSKVAMLTFGERTLLLGVLALVLKPMWAFVVMSCVSVPSTVLLVAGRVRRARVLPGPEPGAARRLAQTTDVVVGPVLRPFAAGRFTRAPALLAFGGVALLVGLAWFERLVLESGGVASALLLVATLLWLATGARHAATGLGPFAFLLPAATVATEFAVVLSAAWFLLGLGAGAAPFAAFCVVLAVTLHRYDVEYEGPRLLRLGLGSDGRMFLVAAVAVITAVSSGVRTGIDLFAVTCAAVVTLLVVRLLIVSSLQVRAALRLRSLRG